MSEELLPKPQTDLPLPEKDLPLPEKELTASAKSNSTSLGQAVEPVQAPPDSQQGPPLQNHPIVKNEKPADKSPALKYLILGIIFVLILGAIGGAYFLGINKSSSKNQAIQTQTTSPTPTPDPTANWQTYTNTKYGYSLKYPQSYSLIKGPSENRPDKEFQTDDQISFSGDKSEQDENSGTSFNIQVNPTDRNGKKIICSSSENCLSNYQLNALAQLPKNTDSINKTIDNQNFIGFRYITNNPLYSQENNYLAFYKDNNFYLISYTLNNESGGKLEKNINQILSTFTFTPLSTSNSTDTSDWKTYNNPQFGVSFKYPPNWTVSSPPPSYDDYIWAIYVAHPTPNGDVFAIRSYQKSISEVFESEKANYINSPTSIKFDEKINLFGLEGRRLTVENSSVPVTYYVYYLNRNGQTLVFITSTESSPNDLLDDIFDTLSIK